MDYPDEFSSKARARVEAERISAGRDLQGYRNKLKARPTRPRRVHNIYGRSWNEDDQDLHEYILRVFLVFAREASTLGRQGLWSVDVVRKKSCQFLRRFTIQALSEKTSDTHKLGWISNWDGSLDPELQREFEKWDHWRDFEDLLLQVAEVQSEEPMTESGPTASSTRQKPGPKPDFETASCVAEIVNRIGGQNWRSKIDDICCELDDAKVPRPKTWKTRGYNSWYACLAAERDLVVKAIEHHLELSKSASGETFS